MPLMLMSTIVFFTIFNIEANRTARTDLEKRMDKVAQIQASSISGPVWFVNFRQLELILKAMSNDPDFLGALVLDEENQVIRSVGELESPDGGFRIIEHPIEYSEFDDDAPRNIGLLRLAYSEKRLLQESSSRLKFASILAVLLTLSTVLSAIAALRYTVKVPLNQLLGAIRKTQETNEHVPILVNRGDEIGTLVNAYNELQKTQKEYETELQQARSGLEQRVEERTEDLLKREKQLSRQSSWRPSPIGSVGKNGIPWSIDSRHCPRDQKPSQLRQQFCSNFQGFDRGTC